MTAGGDLVAGRYRLRSQLGGGGMGAVWLARDELLGRDIAIKQVLVQAGIDDELAAANREAAMREGRIAARLSHPHAVSVYDMVQDDGQPWLVMEYLPSRSLAALLQDRGRLPVPEVAQIGAQVADALTATHAAGVVHRDVKPGNILIGEGNGRDGVVKITDFGISRARGDVSLTQTGVVKGTPAFLAPEVAQGQPPDEASDVFSLGATLYACLEGTPPFGLSDNALQMLHRVAGGQFTPPEHAGALTAPLMRMLAADPTQRPTMPQVRDQLAKLAAGPDRDVTEVLTARTKLPKTLPGMPARPRKTEAEPVAAPARTAVEATPVPSGRSAAASAQASRPPTGMQPLLIPPDEAPPDEAPPDDVPADGGPAAPPAESALGRSAPVGTPAESPSATSTPATSTPATSTPATSTPEGSPRRRKRVLGILAAMVVLGAIAAVLVVLLKQGGNPSVGAQGSTSAPPAPSTSTSASPSASAPASTTAPAATSSAPEATPSAEATPPPSSSPPPTPVDGPPTAAEVRNALTSYYALLPGNPQHAYELTGPRLRAAESRANYVRFWNRFSNVTLGQVSAQDGSLVATGTVTYTENGAPQREQHTFTLVRGEGGQLLIDQDIQP